MYVLDTLYLNKNFSYFKLAIFSYLFTTFNYSLILLLVTICMFAPEDRMVCCGGVDDEALSVRKRLEQMSLFDTFSRSSFRQPWC